ncbi:MAG: pyridoxal phosphate-dependent class II aminotransferase [Oscillospiraceae bacterium]|nr:pyridoxal phosphate-dependent class II aminotransferase [Oscillospiraceae bacterium]
MQPYDHGGNVYGGPRPRVDFSVNVNPLGMPPQVVEALSPDPAADARYPDPACRALRQALSIRFSIPTKNILCGNGSADLLMRICAALRPKNVLLPAPTFSEYARCVRLFGGTVKEYTLSENDGFAITESFLQAVTPDTDMVFLCYPNNPTGRLCPPELVAKLADRCRDTDCYLVIDECFLPFTDGVSALPLLAGHPKLLVLRAFTKIYAMAGLRLGVLLGNDALLDRIAPYGAQWSVSTVAQRCGIAALTNEDWIPQTRQYIRQQRQRMANALTACGLTVYPSDANFLLLRAPIPLAEPLQQRGLWVRKCNNFTGLDDRFIRVGIQNPAENDLLIQSIQEVLHG